MLPITASPQSISSAPGTPVPRRSGGSSGREGTRRRTLPTRSLPTKSRRQGQISRHRALIRELTCLSSPTERRWIFAVWQYPTASAAKERAQLLPPSAVVLIRSSLRSLQAGFPAHWTFRQARYSGTATPTELTGAHDVLDQLTAQLPQLKSQTVEAPSPPALVGALPPGTLLIVGDPGGSWFQRRFVGPGARIRAKASDGTIVVSHRPACVYQVMQPPIAFGPKMRVADALLLSEGLDIHVADRGKLLGTVRIEALESSRRDLEIRQIMDTEIFLSVDDPINEAAGLSPCTVMGSCPSLMASRTS